MRGVAVAVKASTAAGWMNCTSRRILRRCKVCVDGFVYEKVRRVFVKTLSCEMFMDVLFQKVIMPC